MNEKLMHAGALELSCKYNIRKRIAHRVIYETTQMLETNVDRKAFDLRLILAGIERQGLAASKFSAYTCEMQCAESVAS